MTRDQKIVTIGSASGVLTMLAAVTAIFWLWPSNPLLSDISLRLGYTIQANAFAVIPLLLGILMVANARFFSDAIDPTLQKENMAMQINGRVVDNTLQQFVLFLIATTALSVNATSAQMRLIPAATIVFIFARMAFWIGYRIHPTLQSVRHGSDRIPQCGTSWLCDLEGDRVRSVKTQAGFVTRFPPSRQNDFAFGAASW